MWACIKYRNKRRRKWHERFSERKEIWEWRRRTKKTKHAWMAYTFQLKESSYHTADNDEMSVFFFWLAMQCCFYAVRHEFLAVLHLSILKQATKLLIKVVSCHLYAVR
ncbi:unnamed protein product [Orchesella dallaii]|uniref:Uncharacterized protein n=1 Tax=Orchesella dallaii TaxID=48710 RepID=A0ABP1SB05_9HEXA